MHVGAIPRASVLDGAVVTLRGAFKPGTKYTIDIDAGAQDAFGQQALAFRGEVTLDDLSRAFGSEPRSRCSRRQGTGSLPVEAVNCTKLDVEAWSLARQAGSTAPGDSFDKGRRDTLLATVRARQLAVSLKGKRNIAAVYPIACRKAFSQEDRSVLPQDLVRRLRSGRDTVFAQITDPRGAREGRSAIRIGVGHFPQVRRIGADAKLTLYDERRRRQVARQDQPSRTGRPARLGQALGEKEGRRQPFALIRRARVVMSASPPAVGPAASRPGDFNLASDWEGAAARACRSGLHRPRHLSPGETAFVKGGVPLSSGRQARVACGRIQAEPDGHRLARQRDREESGDGLEVWDLRCQGQDPERRRARHL